MHAQGEVVRRGGGGCCSAQREVAYRKQRRYSGGTATAQSCAAKTQSCKRRTCRVAAHLRALELLVRGGVGHGLGLWRAEEERCAEGRLHGFDEQRWHLVRAQRMCSVHTQCRRRRSMHSVCAVSLASASARIGGTSGRPRLASTKFQPLSQASGGHARGRRRRGRERGGRSTRPASIVLCHVLLPAQLARLLGNTRSDRSLPPREELHETQETR